MIGSAAKISPDVAVVVMPEDYAEVTEELKRNDGALSLSTRSSLARKALGKPRCTMRWFIPTSSVRFSVRPVRARQETVETRCSA